MSNSLFIAHNDGGNNPTLFLIDSNCGIIKEVVVKNMANVDWEDVTLDDTGNLYIGDFGNNNHNRGDLRIGVIDNFASLSADSVNARFIEFTYEDQTSFPPPQKDLHFDCESIAWFDDSLYLVTKNWSSPFSGLAKLYVIPAKIGTFEAKLVDSVNLGTIKEIAWVTGLDIQQKELLLIGSAYAWQYHFNERPRFDSLVRRYDVFPLSQKEAICFDGVDAIVADESTGGFGNLYRLSLNDFSDLRKTVQELNCTITDKGITIYPADNETFLCAIFDFSGKELWRGLPTQEGEGFYLLWREIGIPVGTAIVEIKNSKGDIFVRKIYVSP